MLRGSRQVGKTHLLQHLGAEHYERVAYINFEDDPEAADLFAGRLKLEDLLRRMSLHANVVIEPGNTLIILDEIQAAPRALASLKFLHDHGPDYHVAAAGSLLGIKVAADTFPVGKVDFLDLYPMSFLEFLGAVGEELAAKHIEALESLTPLTIHDRLIELLKTYFLVGGMPEVVAAHAAGAEFSELRRIQRAIINGYELDFAKHPGPASSPKIQLIWEAVPKLLARENRKFLYGAIREGARSREYESSLQWLFDAGLLMKARLVQTPRLPLSAYADGRAFKVYMNDVGLLGAMLRVPPEILLRGHRLFDEFSGAFTENYVAQQLYPRTRELYYWTSGASAEVDFILQHGNEVLPLEVKAGINVKSQSLKLYGTRYQPGALSRATARGARTDGAIDNYPLYMVGVFPLETRP